MKEAIRYAFLTDWVHQASTEEIVEKLIQNDERGKKINKAIEILNKWEKENINPVFRKGLLKILKGDINDK